MMLCVEVNIDDYVFLSALDPNAIVSVCKRQGKKVAQPVGVATNRCDKGGQGSNNNMIRQTYQK